MPDPEYTGATTMSDTNDLEATMTTTMRVFHATTEEAAAQILRAGFRDVAGTFGTDQEWRGVWVADRPIDRNEGCAGDTVLTFTIPAAMFLAFEWCEADKPYREALLPAERVNAQQTGLCRYVAPDGVVARPTPSAWP